MSLISDSIAVSPPKLLPIAIEPRPAGRPRKRERQQQPQQQQQKNDPIPLSVEYNRCKYGVDSTVGLRERERSSKSTAQVERLEKV